MACPSSLIDNWEREFNRWLGPTQQPKRKILRRGSDAPLLAAPNKVGQVYISSYDLWRSLPAPKNIALLIVDEGHRLKNSSGSRTLSALESLAVDARLLLTATPLQNNLSEFYTLLKFVRPNDLVGNMSEFRQRPELLEEACRSFLLRRLQSEVLTTMLPPRTEFLCFCKPTPLQQQEYTSHHGPLTDALVVLTKLRKICSHPGLLEPSQTTAQLESSGKLIVLAALLQRIRSQAPTDKVVIVSNFTSALSLVDQLILQPNNYSFVRLDGATDVAQRQIRVDSFHRTSTFCMLLSAKAGGCGLNLVGANRLVLLDPDWNPATDVQAMGRVYRQGQTKPCYIYRLFTAGTVEELIYQRQCQKLSLAAVVEGGKLKDSWSPEEVQQFMVLHPGCTTLKQLQWKNEPPVVDSALASVQKHSSKTLLYVHTATKVQEPKDEDGQRRSRSPTPEASTFQDSSDSDSEFEF